jgi:hypothetical protein
MTPSPETIQRLLDELVAAPTYHDAIEVVRDAPIEIDDWELIETINALIASKLDFPNTE